MSFNVNNIRNWASTASRMVTAVRGTPLPSIPTGSWGAGWYDLGAITSDGVSESVTQQETKVFIMQGGSLARTLRSQFEHPFTVVAAEENAVSMGLARPNTTVVTTGGTAEVETITMTATGGTWSLSSSLGLITSLAYNVSTASLATQLSTLFGVTVTVSGTAGSSYVITWPATYGNVTQLILVTTALTGGTATIATTTPGVNAINTSQVAPAASQNIRQFGFDFSDDVVHLRYVLTYAEAVQSGEINRRADAISTVPLTINPYLDPNTNAFFTEINDDPNRISTLFV